jgi:hypothetical protein
MMTDRMQQLKILSENDRTIGPRSGRDRVNKLDKKALGEKKQQ